MGKVAAVIIDFKSVRNDQQMIDTLQFGVKDSPMEYSLFHLSARMEAELAHLLGNPYLLLMMAWILSF
jgi:hypothetical protein